MEITTTTAASILTKQTGGFLSGEEGAFTHSLACYTGCQFGRTSCGEFCYARDLPNWKIKSGGAKWGDKVFPKENAPELLEKALAKMQPEKRRGLRIFMSTSTDPYQPLETRHGITRRCLEVFARYDDLDLLLIQTRSPLVRRDFDLIAGIPYAWLSMTVETDDPTVFKLLKGGPSVVTRMETVRLAVARDVQTQVAVSPCLPYTDGFAETLVGLGARRVVVDTFVDGDGSGGKRTARSPYAVTPGWDATAHAHALYDRLAAAGLEVGWSAAGFCGILSRHN